MLLIEVSTEAGRKIGGIYTVLRSKAPQFAGRFGQDYYLVGMHDEKCDSDVKYAEPPKEFAPAIKELAEQGIEIKYGTWICGSNAKLFLINFRGMFGKSVKTTGTNGKEQTDSLLNHYKYLLWKHYGVDSINDQSWDLSESVLWGVAAGMLIEKLIPVLRKRDRDIVCQFHEWLTGPALLYLKMNRANIKTVFTTHATVLGRSMSSAGRDVYLEAASKNHPVNPSECYRYGVESKYFIERACAHNADVFTTVSDTTAMECEYILDKKPDVVTLNGMDFVELEKEYGNPETEAYNRNEMKQFVESYFIPHYDIDMRKCKLIYISGRYEYLNKGFDIYIEGLGKLNQRLKKENWNGTAVAFIFAPSAITGPRDSIIKNYLLLDKMSELLSQVGIDEIYKSFGSTYRAIEAVPGQRLKQDLNTMKKGFVRDGERPPLNSHTLQYGNDIVMNECARAGLTNSAEDRVKIIFYPTYVSSNDGILNMDYYSILQSTDIGVFPSRYEPFGYTPVEAGMMRNISITSDTTGFGRFIESKLGFCENIEHGIAVIKMFRKQKEDVVERFSNLMHQILMLDGKSFRKLQEDAYAVAHLCDWAVLAKNYYKAYELALKR